MKNKTRISSAILSVFLSCILIFSPITSVITYAITGPAISVENVKIQPGKSVEVDISLNNNPGIASMVCNVSYDTNVLTLTNVAYGADFASKGVEPYINGSPVKLVWSDVTEQTTDSVFATLTFTVSDTAESGTTTNVTLSYSQGDICDIDENDVDFTIENGTITIVDGLPGDINADQIVNAKDLLRLNKYFAGWDVEVDEIAIDVNGDGTVNAKDLLRLNKYFAGWDVEIFYGEISTKMCAHSMTATEAVAATCTTDGNIAYWYCSLCNKYFSDSNGTTEISLEDTKIEAYGHTPVIDPAKQPTKTETGLTEGSHCSVCKAVLVEQQILPVLTGYAITYNIATGNSASYIAAQGLDATIEDEKRQYFSDEGIVELPILSLDGYQFLGWYTAPPENSNAVQVKEIAAGSVGNYTLYAHWHEYEYDITYKLYQTPLAPITDSKYLTYTVSKGKVDLPNPELYNYVFLGWYTDDGEEVTRIPAGTTGDITLNAYWTSKRNLTKAVSSLEDPIVIENSDSGVIYFTYELGTIENVPLSDAIWTIQSVAGLAQQKSETVSTTISQEQASEISKTISNTTVDSATWTLSSDWNENTEVSEEWAEQNGMTKEEANTVTKSSSGTYSFTSSSGGANTTTKTDGTTTIDYDSQNTTRGNSAEFNAKISGKYSNEGNISSKVAGTFEVSGEVGGGYKQHKETDKHTGTDTNTVDTTVEAGTSTWNNASTSSSTKSASESASVRSAMSSIISNTKGYGKSYSTGGENSESQGFSSTDSQSSNTSSTLTYFTSETKTTTTTYSTDGKSEGCYRLVVAGTIHVFGVVGYDVATKSYFAYTYNVLDDKTYEFLDYSPTLSFDDYENGAIPFEVPYFVYEYVTEKTAMTSGLAFRTDTTNGTATVAGYTGSETDVTIPSYFTSGNVAYKVTGLSASAFAGKNVRSVVLSDYITEIPDGAFKNCTALEQVSGYYTKIGAEAFSGCVSLENYNITPAITEIGENAFAGVNSIYVNALNSNYALADAKLQKPELATDSEQLLAIARATTQNVVDAAVNSGAANIVLNISNITDGTVLTINVPEIASFELKGGLKSYNDLKLISKADTTTIKEITVNNCTRIPLEIASETLNFDAASVEGPGFVLLLSAQNPTVTMTRDSRLISLEKEAVVWRNPTIVSEIIDNTVGTLDITGNVYVYGEIDGVENINVVEGEIIPISESEFENYIKGVYKISFNANGGNVSTTEKTVFYGSDFGELPTPTRDYYTFDGWFKSDGTQVTANTTMSEAKDITLVAHWTLNDASGWVLASNVPAGAEIVNQKWTYNLTTRTTSNSSTAPSGYTSYKDPTWVWGSYGSWSSWSKTAAYDSDSRDAETRTISATYKTQYYYDRYSASGNQWTSYAKGTYSGYYCGTYQSTGWLDYRLTVKDYPDGRARYGSYGSINKDYWYNEQSRQVEVTPAYTEYRYRDRSKVYTYYYQKVESKESTTAVSASDTISNVQKWVQYRAK